MLTIRAIVREKDERPGGRFPVKILVTKDGDKKMFESSFVFERGVDTSKDLKKFKQTKNVLAAQRKANDYLDMANALGAKLDFMSSAEIRDYVRDYEKITQNKNKFIDFIAEGYAHAKACSEGTGANIVTAMNHFKDFVRQDSFDITHLTSDVLRKFHIYLISEKTIVRNDIKFRPTTIFKKGMGNTTAHSHIARLKSVFNIVKAKYNGEHNDDILIRNDPFNKHRFKMPVKDQAKKRNLKPASILNIRDYKKKFYSGSHGTNRVELAQDIFMLSFYLVGMNTIDLYNVTTYKSGRLDYNRSKTKNKRKDHAFISIKVEPEASDILNKYLDPTGERVFIFHKMYANSKSFNKNLNWGLKKLVKLCDPDMDIKTYEQLSTYYARHSWATIARNICKINKDDIAESLNHSSDHDVTDVYIERDWSLIDEANRKVLDVIKSEDITLQQVYELVEEDFLA